MTGKKNRRESNVVSKRAKMREILLLEENIQEKHLDIEKNKIIRALSVVVNLLGEAEKRGAFCFYWLK
jgi:hypothetical protein